MSWLGIEGKGCGGGQPRSPERIGEKTGVVEGRPKRVGEIGIEVEVGERSEVMEVRVEAGVAHSLHPTSLDSRL